MAKDNVESSKRTFTDEEKIQITKLLEDMSLSGDIDNRSLWQKLKDRLLG